MKYNEKTQTCPTLNDNWKVKAKDETVRHDLNQCAIYDICNDSEVRGRVAAVERKWGGR